MSFDRPTVATPAVVRIRAQLAPLLDEIRAGVLDRERTGELPSDQIAQLIAAGVGAWRVPTEHGGSGLTLPEQTQLWVDLATADQNLTQALRGHFAFAEDRLYQHARGIDQTKWFERLVGGDLVGNAWSETANSIDSQGTVLRPDGAGYRINGAKFYTTGTIFGQWADTYALRQRPGHDDDFVIALVRTDVPEVTVSNDWNGFGQRGTGSGTTTYHNAAVDAEDVTVFTDRYPYQTALYQVNLLATLTGIAKATVRDVVDQVRARERNFSHANSARVRDDPQVLATVGTISAAAYVAEAATIRAATALQDAFDAVDADEATRDEINRIAELESSAAQVVVSDLALQATTTLFDTLGASATDLAKGLDRHWRNARTVSSHNPRLFKARVVGAAEVNATPPPYAWAIGRTPEPAVADA